MDIRRVCKTCDGTGVVERGDGETRFCYSCKGVGWHDRGLIQNGTKTLNERLNDVEDKVNDCIDKLNDIFEKLNEP